MAVCKECGGKISLFGGCQKCASEKAQKEAEREEQIKNVLLTSETAIHHGVVERYGFIMVEELNSGLDVGLKKMADQLLPKLQKQAFDMGGNAVVAVRVEAIKIMDVGIGVTEMSKFVFVASGTAVKIDNG